MLRWTVAAGGGNVVAGAAGDGGADAGGGGRLYRGREGHEPGDLPPLHGAGQRAGGGEPAAAGGAGEGGGRAGAGAADSGVQYGGRPPGEHPAVGGDGLRAF